MGITQAQLSRIENGPPIRNLDTLCHWARTLRIPECLLWFRLPEAPATRSETAEATAPVISPAELRSVASSSLPAQALANILAAVTGTSLPGEPVTRPAAHPQHVTRGKSQLSWGLEDPTYDQLTSWLRSWAETMERRNFLQVLGWAATAAAAAPLIGLDADEQVRLGRAIAAPNRVDEGVITHIDAILTTAMRQDDALGPQAVLQTVLAQGNLARLMLTECPGKLRPRLLSVYGNLSTFAGWLFFDLNDFDSAWHYYQQGRSAAHEARNHELGIYALCEMSYVAAWQRKSSVAIDYAAAAQSLAAKIDDMRLRSYVADRAARVYAMDGQAESCVGALDQAEAHLTQSGRDLTPGSLVYFYNDGLLTNTKSKCRLQLGQPQETAAIARQALASVGTSFVRNRAFGKLYLGNACLASGETDEAAFVTAEVADLAMQNRSPRLLNELRVTRAKMEPWKDRAAVKDLDERLAAYGLR
jgi:hypothetical protein